MRTPEEFRTAIQTHTQPHTLSSEETESKMAKTAATARINPLLTNSAFNMAHIFYAQGTINYHRQNEKRAAKLGIDLPPCKKSPEIQRRLSFFMGRTPTLRTTSVTAEIKL